MKMFIYLSDHKQYIFSRLMEEENCCTDPEITMMVINVFSDKKLRYNTKTGKTYLSNYKMAEYVYKSDIPDYDSGETGAYWQFCGFIRNGVSRYNRGFEII